MLWFTAGFKKGYLGQSGNKELISLQKMISEFIYNVGIITTESPFQGIVDISWKSIQLQTVIG